jgi:hypothetical protein
LISCSEHFLRSHQIALILNLILYIQIPRRLANYFSITFFLSAHIIEIGSNGLIRSSQPPDFSQNKRIESRPYPQKTPTPRKAAGKARFPQVLQPGDVEWGREREKEKEEERGMG